ncbi:MAG TPA: hypothetical protein VHW65_00395 [Gemmatimonadales bacterium]|jgi:hypothetical protein|nr:hypothetical protein [Gemmatimonadales bacterium]
MARRIVDTDGGVWEVGPSGRRTQYGADETSLEFLRVAGGTPDRRFARFSPRGAKAAELALDEASDTALLTLLSQAQPAWTSPDGSYGRPA